MVSKTKITDKQKLFKYFNITKELITCKYETIIELNINDYKIGEEELGSVQQGEGDEPFHAEELNDDSLSYVYSIVGIFNAYIPEFNESIPFAFPFNIELFKTENTTIKNGLVTIIYEPGDKLILATTKDSGTDLNVITKLMDNQVKYLHGNIEKTVEVLWDQIAKTNPVKFHHIELIYTILYGESTPDGYVPVRLGSQKYTKLNAISSKDSAHNFGTSNALNFGYSNDAILKNVIRKPNTEPPKSDLEKIISAEYHNLNIQEGEF
jgi:hypothetical protein